jgi:hypothetical protein
LESAGRPRRRHVQQGSVVYLAPALDAERARVVDLPNPLQRRDLNWMTPLARSIIARAHIIERERKIAARVHELRRLAERTADAYQRALIASGLPPEHFQLRMMLLGRLLPPPRKGA